MILYMAKASLQQIMNMWSLQFTDNMYYAFMT